MSPAMYAAGAALALLAIGIVTIPLLRHRQASGVGLTLVILVVGLPLSIAGIYSVTTTFPWDDPAQAEPQAAAPAGKLPAVDEMITELEARLEREPDPEGYVLLGRSYMQLQRYADAVDAWHTAWELTEGANPDIALGYAEALVLADKRTLKTSAADLLDSVLAVRPADQRALWYGGMSSAARGRNSEAVQRFSALLQGDLPAEFRTAVQDQLAKLGTLPSTNDAGQVAAATDNSATAVKGDAIKVTVTISPDIAPLASPNSTLFVFAREADRPGPPAAVKRLRAGQLPMSLTLSDADAMAPGMRLANVQKMKLVARLSASGNAISAPGDLYGEVLPEMEDGVVESVTIVIDSVAQ
jgi:cytochrome c-type biogenesis protein CcmH